MDPNKIHSKIDNKQQFNHQEFKYKLTIIPGYSDLKFSLFESKSIGVKTNSNRDKKTFWSLRKRF